MADLISIGIPIYNVEKYLDQCLKSLQRQTYTHIEVIMVDNGSTDKSCNIARKYENTDSRFVLYKTTKRGASAARNICLEKARGNYITFVDSDDWCEPDYLERMIKAAKTDNTPMVICNFYTGDKITGNWNSESMFAGGGDTNTIFF